MKQTTTLHFTSSDAIIVVLLSGLWLGMIVLINPVGDFPTNDDWDFGLSTIALADNGAVTYSNRQSLPILGQMLWGASFCRVFGSSFTTLRYSTLVISWIGLLAVYWLLQRFICQRKLALVGTLILMANPLYVLLSFSFMTDAPFLVMCVVSTILLFIGLEQDRHGYCAMGLGLACIATLTRQLGLAIPISFCIAWLIKNGYRHRWWLEAALPTLSIALALYAFGKIVEATIGLPEAYGTKTASMFQLLGDVVHLHLGALKYPAKRHFITFIYLGLFTFPLSVLLIPGLWRTMIPTARRRTGVGITIFVAAAITVCVSAGWIMPMIGNNFVDFGVGLQSLAGEASKAPALIWIAITLISVLGCALFLVLIAASGWKALFRRSHQTRFHAWHFVMLVVLCALGIGPSSWMYMGFFDRHVLLLLPFCLLLILVAVDHPYEATPKWAVCMSVAWLTICFWFSIGATHDYLDWNRARWQGGLYLIQELGLPVADVDGGFEFNQYFPHKADLRPDGVKGVIRKPDSPYVISFEPLDGHKIIKRLDCNPWLPWSVRHVWLLARPGRTSTQPHLSPTTSPTSNRALPSNPQITARSGLFKRATLPG